MDSGVCVAPQALYGLYIVPPLVLRRAVVMAAATAVTCVTLTGLAVPASVAAVMSGQPGSVVPFTISPPVGVAAAGSASADPVPASLKTPGSAGGGARPTGAPRAV